MKTTPTQKLVFALTALAAGAPFASLHAADVTWDNGAADGLWTSGVNWSTNAVPTAADSAVIGGTGNVDATSMATVDAMRLTRAVSISGGTITMDAITNGAGSGIFQVDTGSYAATIGSNLSFSGSTTSGTVSTFRLHNTYTGTTTINGTVTTGNIGTSGSPFVDISGATGTTGTIVFNNSITYARTTGNTDFNLNRGTMELNAANTWNLGGASFRFNPQVSTGTGTLKLGHSTALGVSTNDLYLGTTDATIGSGTYVMQALQTGANTVANRVFIRNSALTTVLGADIASGTATYSGNLTLNNVTTGGTAGAINLKSVQAGGTVDFTGVIANGNTGQAVVRNLTIGDATTGLGTVRFTNANTYTGATAVTAGTFLVNGSHTGGGNYSVTGTLGGSGTITPASGSTFTVNSGGILAPGSAIGSIGTLTFDGVTRNGAVATFSSGAKFNFDLNGTSVTSDKIQLNNGASGDFVFNNNVIDFTSIVGSLVHNSTFTLFSASAANNYSGLTLDGSNRITSGLSIGTGLGASFSGSYLSVVGNDIILTAIPEPSSFAALAGLGILGFAAFRRRRAA